MAETRDDATTETSATSAAEGVTAEKRPKQSDLTNVTNGDAQTPVDADMQAEATEKQESTTQIAELSPTETQAEQTPGPILKLKIVYQKTTHVIEIDSHNTVKDLKEVLQPLTGVPTTMQKLMFRGLLSDAAKICDTGLTENAKVMLVGSKVSDVVQINKVPTRQELQQTDASGSGFSTESLCKQTAHKKVLDKGKPDNTMTGVKDRREPLPQTPLSGMITKDGGPVRLTFKLELDEIWIGTKERTQKIPMNSIKDVKTDKIPDHEEYSILGIQIGPTTKSTIWLYWVPSQYADAVKDTILGKFVF